jgi:hypothetical protein
LPQRNAMGESRLLRQRNATQSQIGNIAFTLPSLPSTHFLCFLSPLVP